MHERRQPASSPIRLEPALERSFLEHIMETDDPKTRVYLIIGICVFLAFLVSDRFMVPTEFPNALLARLIATALMCVLLVVYLRYSRSYEGRNTLICLGAFVANLAITFIALLAFKSGEYSYQYGTILILAVLFGTFNTPFWYSLFTGISISAVYLCAIGVYLYMEDPQTKDTTPMHYWLNSALICAAFTIIGLLAVYRRESYRRALFEQFIQEKQRAEKEQELSWLDEDIELYNKKYYEAKRKEWFAECKQKQTRLSTLFIDVDFFKSCNDNVGYGYGNFVLKSIAKVLKDTLERFGCEGFAARWGGDEFVVLAKDLAPDRAEDLAHQIRRNVLKEGLGTGRDDVVQEGQPKKPSYVTVSIGAVTVTPEHDVDLDRIENTASRLVHNAKAKKNDVYSSATLDPLS